MSPHHRLPGCLYEKILNLFRLPVPLSCSDLDKVESNADNGK